MGSPVPERLQPLLESVRPLAERFDAAGFKLYLVGGVVRDAVLGRPLFQDLDFTTDARPEDTLGLVEGWAESVSMEVRHFGIDVICVEPGPYRTDIWDTSERTISEDGPYAEMAAKLERFAEERVIPRARDPQEVATTIADALEAARPRFRYPVGPEAHMLWAARGKVPHRVFENLTARLTGMPRE